MQFSKLLPRLLAMFLLLAPIGAMAQQSGGIYAAFSTTALSTSGSPEFNGVTFGGFDEFGLKNSLDFMRIGGDARISIVHANQSVAYIGVSSNDINYLIGPVVSFKAHAVRPYVEFLVGGAHVSANASAFGASASASQSYGETDYVGGLDWTLATHLAWRVAEVNYGRFNGISATTFSTGLVLRFP